MKLTYQLNQNFFHPDPFYYLVDDSEIKEGDWFLLDKPLQYNSENYKWVTASLGKIIITNNPSLPIQQIEFPDKEDEDIERSARQFMINELGYSHYTTDVFGKKVEYYLVRFIKANPFQFTEQDMKECLEHSYEMGYEDRDKDIGYESNIPYLKEIHLASKVKLIVEFDIEMEEMVLTTKNDILDSQNKGVHYWQPKLNSENKIVALKVKYK